MDLSVVVPTLNGRDRLAVSLDALSEHAPDAEVVVVNGPSADGTTGMVRDRDDVDVLIEVSARNVNVARNAGIDAASGDAIALVGYDLAVTESWVDAVTTGLDESSTVTGPVHESLRAGMTTESAERERLRGRDVTFLNGRNVAFRADVLDILDGFDEYLEVNGARDLAHRLANAGYGVAWQSDMGVTHDVGADGGTDDVDWEWQYRALAYSLVKNYGPHPQVVGRLLTRAGLDATHAARDLLHGEGTPTGWMGTGRDVVSGIATGVSDGLVARARDGSPAKNPHGLSARADRAVAQYDWR